MRLSFKTLLTVAALTVSSAANAQSYGANDTSFLNFVGELEANRGFSDVHRAAPFLPPQTIETMTIAQVFEYQEALRANDAIASAVGRYQFNYLTLKDVVAQLGISTDIIFDSEVQTYLARHLLQMCGFYNQDADMANLANCLAGRWAALPKVTGSDAGKSAYEGLAGNKAGTTPEMFLAVLDARFTW
jgi:hypothetical protein